MLKWAPHELALSKYCRGIDWTGTTEACLLDESSIFQWVLLPHLDED